MSRILTVYSSRLRPVKRADMAEIRWHRISSALAALGHTVHMASAELPVRFRRTLGDSTEASMVPIARVDWQSYDMVKTLFHSGFETLEKYGGTGHRFIVSKLGSVVAATEMEGIYFYGRQCERMYQTQRRIAATSRYVTLLSESAISLWREMFGDDQNTLLVPGAADAIIPPPGRDPYPDDAGSRCVFSGNFYDFSDRSQPEAHRVIASKLNRIGELLQARKCRLFVVGPGDHRSLDSRYVTYCGTVTHDESWNFLHFADVGLVVAAGRFMHNNESTKIYHYLRAGLPVVSEAGFPNDNVVRDSGLGFVVDNGALELMAEQVIAAAAMTWDRERAVKYILSNHTWAHRASVYDGLLRAR